MHRLILICLSLLSFAALAEASTRPRTCRILYLSAPKDAPRQFYLFDGETTRQVEPGRMSFSPVYALRPGDIKLALSLTPIPAVATDGQIVVPAGTPTTKVPESISDLYLFVSSDPSNPVAPVKIQAVDAGMTGFSQGSMLWFNLTENTIAGILGSRKLRIASNSRTIVEPPATGSEDYYVNIHYATPGETHGEPLCETRWQHDPRSRGVFFIIKDATHTTPRIIGIPDFRTEQVVTARDP